MDFKLYGDNILVPVKCGTRFLMDCGLRKSTHYTVTDLYELRWIPEVKYIIVREPLEHFQSALRQDVLKVLNGVDESVHNDAIHNVLAKYRLAHEDVHYYTKLYESIYWYWRRNRTKGIEIINIKDLSEFTESLGLKHTYEEGYYNQQHQPNWMEKDDFALWVKTNYSTPFNACVNEIIDDIHFYNSLINKEVLPIKIM